MARGEIFDRLEAYGADMGGIGERFSGDREKYCRCLGELLDGNGFDELSRAADGGRRSSAFDLSRLLRDQCHDLGLTPLYESVCVLVEILRPGADNDTASDAAAMKSARGQMKTVLAKRGEAEKLLNDIRAIVNKTPAQAAPAPRKKRGAAKYLSSVNRAMIIISAIIVAVGVIGTFIFAEIIHGYRENVKTESAVHLIEIVNQIKQYAQNSIESDWKAAYSVSSGLTHTGDTLNDEDILAYIQRERDIWGVSDVILYNAAGFGFTASGTTISNSEASDAAYYAQKLGEYMTVVRSQVTYVVPVTTKTRYNGSSVVAASVVRDMNSLVDGMGLSSFGGTASVYLANETGVVMSRLSRNSAETFNVKTLWDEGRLCGLNGTPVENSLPLTAEETTAFTLREDGGDMYAVSSPVSSRQGKLRLLYLAPEKAVNENMQSFSTRIMIICVAVIMLFAALSVAAFVLVYNERKKQFSSVLSKRERTFDLLVKNSQTAFALFTPNKPDEEFISANAEKIIGGERLTIVKTPEGFLMEGTQGRDTEISAMMNRKMRYWDGKREFHSGYMPRGGRQGSGYFEVTLYPLDENSDEYVGIAQDVTRRHDREEAVKEALDMARRSDESKTRFLSNMSHDIRTPLNAIVNMTKFAKDASNDAAKRNEYLDIISESSDHLLNLINDILDMSRIESGRSTVGQEPLDLRSEVMRCVDITRPLAEAKKQRFSTDFSRAYTRDILGDRLKLGQILLNVLGNAVKFTPEGGNIDFTVMQTDSLSADLATFRFIVSDDGVGIAKEHLPHIFEAFVRSDDSRVIAEEGTGLGLSICQSFVLAMGGTIKCESVLNKGSVFTIELPFKTAPASTERENAGERHKAEGQFEGKRCLVFEDNKTNRVIARTILEKCGFEVDTAIDGKDGLQKFLSSKPGYYDIIYMDIRMPGMNGYEAAKAIRESRVINAKTIPIIAMTANVFAEDIEKSRKAGMNGHLGKPVDVSELIKVTSSALNTEGGHE